MSASHNNSSNNGGTNEPRVFKVPTLEEMEERRRKLESEKPPLLFKPKISGFAANATKPATAHSSASGSSSAMRTPQASSDSSQAPGIVRSQKINDNQQKQQHPQQQQQHPSQPRRTSIGRSKTTTSSAQDDEFGFDDLDDLDFHDDDFFNLEDDAPAKPTPGFTPVPTTTATPTTTSSTSTSSSSAATPTAGSSASPATAKATPPPFVPKSKSAIVIRTSQRGNPLLQYIRNVPYEYGDIAPDYAVGLTSCILFLSIRYHRLHPEYIFSRIADLGKSYVLRVILILVDVDSHQQAIRELTRVGMVNDFTVICAWSNEEAARYIETFKAYENKAPDAIKERVENDYLSKLTDSLTQIQSINKTDVVTLSSTFGSFKNIMNASVDELGLLPGFGERKVKRLLEAFDQPFAIDPKKRRHRSNR